MYFWTRPLTTGKLNDSGHLLAHDCDTVPTSDRLLNLVESPLGAMALLAGLMRQCEGGPLNLLVRPRHGSLPLACAHQLLMIPV